MLVILTIFFMFVYCILEIFCRDGKASRKYRKTIFNPDICLLKAICMIIVLVILLFNRFVIVDTVTLAENPTISVVAYLMIIGMIVVSFYEREKSKKILEEMERNYEKTDIDESDSNNI